MAPLRARTDRFLEIGEVLVKHGLGFVLGGLSASWAAPLRRVRLLDPQWRISQPEHLRLALEELGPTFVKVGQLLSIRGDLLPPAYTRELAKLQDSAPAVDFRDLVAPLLDGPEGALLDSFESIDTRPLATGSIGQVHAAVFHGHDVVLKIRKPGVLENVRLDLDILADLAELISRYLPAARNVDVVELTRQFSASLSQELDYTVEGRTCDEFAANFAEDPMIRIPRIHWEATTGAMLTQERIRGLKISDLAGLEEQGIDRHELAVRATDALCTMVFRDGLFHADPHPGNLFVQPDGGIGIIDFGMVGRLSEEFRAQLVPLLIGVTARDARQTARAVLRLTARPDSSVTARELAPDLSRILETYAGQDLENMEVGKLLADIMAMLKKRDLVLPAEAALLLKMIVTAESMGEHLDPGFDIVAVLTPHARRFVTSRLSISALNKRLRQALKEAAGAGLDAPDSLRKVMAVIENGGFDVHLRAEELEELIRKVEVIGNRLVAGAILAALINGSSKVISSQPEKYGRFNTAVIGSGLGGAGVLIGYLGWSIRPRHLIPWQLMGRRRR